MTAKNPINVLARHLDADKDWIVKEKYDCYGLPVFSVGRAEYACATSERKADKAAEVYIRDSLWAFNADFIASHAKGEMSDRAIDSLREMQGKLCEDANPIVESMIKDMKEFVSDAIGDDGRGHFLASYDGEEMEAEGMYFYRIN